MARADRSRGRRLLAAFSGKRIGVLGDFMLDEMLQGEATRISPEAPVPVVLVNHPNAAADFPGGAGNVAANIAALDGRAIPWGLIGADPYGERLCELLEAHGIEPRTLVRERGRTTPRKLRIAAHHQQLLRLDFEQVAPMAAGTRRTLTSSLRRSLGRLEALVVSDYQKGSVDSALCREVLPLARARGVPVFVDPKPGRLEPCLGATVVTPNLQEAERFAGIAMRDRAALEKGGRLLLNRFQCEYLLVTRGSEGMSLLGRDGSHVTIPSRSHPVFDVTGAGDTVIATLALAVSAGASMKEAAQIANVAAGVVVMKFGTAQISRAELAEALRA